MSDDENSMHTEGVFRDRERVAFREGLLATEIEGFGRLSRAQQRLLRLDPEMRVRDQLGSFYRKIRSLNAVDLKGYSFGVTEDILQDLFERFPLKIYKNPYLFLMAYIFRDVVSAQGGTRALEVIHSILHSTGEHWILDSDIIRYHRLLLRVDPPPQSST